VATFVSYVKRGQLVADTALASGQFTTAMLAMAYQCGLLNTPMAQQANVLMAQPNLAQAQLEARIADLSQRLAVVGNAPTLLEQQHGQAIDDHDWVLRFNNYTTSQA
jgi:hypothetical protein